MAWEPPVGEHDRVVHQIDGKDCWLSTYVLIARHRLDWRDRTKKFLATQLPEQADDFQRLRLKLLAESLVKYDEECRLAEALLADYGHLFPESP